jgi:methionyl-tRNA formyltransferase
MQKIMTKKTEDLHIVFMGTPEFAVSSLDQLVQHGCRVVGIVTAPDRPAGRGLKLQQSAVKQYADARDIPCLQPANLKDPQFVEALRAWAPDLQVVVAFRMLPEVVWNLPPLGTINLHASLLPAYRGAAPIQWAIIRGETETGVTTFKLQHAIDTGSIIYQEKVPIGPEETAGELHDRLMEVGASLVLKTVRSIASGSYPLTPQNPAVNPPAAPKLFTEDGHIDWTLPCQEVFNRIRGLSPYPGAWTYLNGKVLKILGAAKKASLPVGPAGTVDTDGRDFIRVACRDGWIDLKTVQLQGKKRMDVDEFLRGYRTRPIEIR